MCVCVCVCVLGTVRGGDGREGGKPEIFLRAISLRAKANAARDHQRAFSNCVNRYLLKCLTFLKTLNSAEGLRRFWTLVGFPTAQPSSHSELSLTNPYLDDKMLATIGLQPSTSCCVVQ